MYPKNIKKSFGIDKRQEMRAYLPGLTFIEVLVAVIIIALLASIIFIAVPGAKEKTIKAKVENDMAEVTKIANNCNAFGGAVVQTSFNDNFSPPKAICDDSNISGQTEKSVVVGSYPVLPESYLYENAADEDKEGVFAVVSHNFPIGHTPQKVLLKCTVSGCIKDAQW